MLKKGMIRNDNKIVKLFYKHFIVVYFIDKKICKIISYSLFLDICVDRRSFLGRLYTFYYDTNVYQR